jgi:FMN phosphatase YigB (HAD superfamily)
MEVSKMKATLKNECVIKAVAWDNESVLTTPDWKVCYDIAYEKLSIAAPLAGDPSRGKQYKKMLSVPITEEINKGLGTFVEGNQEVNYLQSYTSGHINSEEFWPIACRYGFGLDVTDQNVDAIRDAQRYLLRDHTGKIRLLREVVEILLSLAEIMPEYVLSNTNPEIYEGFKNADFLKVIPEENRLFSIFIKCRKPSTESYKTLIKRAGCEPQEILFIDDKESNIEAACNSGIKGILFNGQKESEKALISHLESFGIVFSE